MNKPNSQRDLEILESIQETVRAVNKLLPKPPPEEDAYLRAESKRASDLFMQQGKYKSSYAAYDALHRRPLFFAWEIRKIAASVQSEIAMQHGYENARISTPNVDALEAQQALVLLDQVIQLDRHVRNDLRKAASGIDGNEMKGMLLSTEWAVTTATAFVGCKFSRAFYAPKISTEKNK